MRTSKNAEKSISVPASKSRSRNNRFEVLKEPTFSTGVDPKVAARDDVRRVSARWTDDLAELFERKRGNK